MVLDPQATHPPKDVPSFQRRPRVFWSLWGKSQAFQRCPKTSQSLLETSHSLLELPRNMSDPSVDFPGRSRVFWRRSRPFQNFPQISYSAFFYLIVPEVSRDVPEASGRFQKCPRALQRRPRSLKRLSEKSHTLPEVSQSVQGAGRSIKIVSSMFTGAGG